MAAKKLVPSLAFKLKFDTAVSLQTILTAQYSHALEQQKQGRSALMNSFETIMPFYNALSQYVEDNS